MTKIAPWILLLAGVGALLPGWSDTSPATPGAVADPWHMVGALAVVGALLFLLPRTLRQLQHARTTGPRRIEVLEVHPVAPRRSLILVRVGGETLLVGSSEAGLSSLGRIEPEDLTEDPAPLDCSESELLPGGWLDRAGGVLR